MRPRICRPRKRSLQRRLSTTPALSRRLPRSDRECASLLLAWPALLLVRRRLAWPWLLLVGLCLASWARLGWRLGLAWVAWRASGRAPRVPRASRRPRVSASVGSIANVAKAASAMNLGVSAAIKVASIENIVRLERAAAVSPAVAVSRAAVPSRAAEGNRVAAAPADTDLYGDAQTFRPAPFIDDMESPGP